MNEVALASRLRSTAVGREAPDAGMTCRGATRSRHAGVQVPTQVFAVGVAVALFASAQGVAALPSLMRLFGAERATHGPYVVLTDLVRPDPYFAAAKHLQKRHRATLVRLPPGRLVEAVSALRAKAPQFVAVVLRPERHALAVVFFLLESRLEWQ